MTQGSKSLRKCSLQLSLPHLSKNVWLISNLICHNHVAKISYSYSNIYLYLYIFLYLYIWFILYQKTIPQKYWSLNLWPRRMRNDFGGVFRLIRASDSIIWYVNRGRALDRYSLRIYSSSSLRFSCNSVIWLSVTITDTHSYEHSSTLVWDLEKTIQIGYVIIIREEPGRLLSILHVW